MSTMLTVGIVATLIVVGTLLILAVLVSMFRKVGPNEALVVYGFGGTRVVCGGGTFIWPMVQRGRSLSLELMSFDVAPQKDLYTNQGVAVTVEAVSQLKVKSDPESILTAAEQFLNKSFEDRDTMIKLIMEGHLRGIVGQLTVEQIVKEPGMVGDKMRSTCSEELAKMGLEVVSFTIKEVRDKNEYITNMGKPDIARVRKEADIAAAVAERDTAIQRAIAARESAVAKAQADQERVVAETQSQAKQAEATRDLELKQAEYKAAVQRANAQTDKTYEIQTNVMQQQVVAEQVKVDWVKKEQEIQVQEMEIQRREKELVATVLKQAEMEKRRIETLADAERLRAVLEAQGQAEAARAQGQANADVARIQGTAEADVVKLKGTAEAEITLAKGKAEAEAMQAKARSYQEYNQAAILDKILTGLPDLAKALAMPLSKVDKITVVSTDGASSGVNHVTADLSKIVAQTPALVETLTGLKVADLLARLPALPVSPDGDANKKNGQEAAALPDGGQQ